MTIGDAVVVVVVVDIVVVVSIGLTLFWSRIGAVVRLRSIG